MDVVSLLVERGIRNIRINFVVAVCNTLVSYLLPLTYISILFSFSYIHISTHIYIFFAELFHACI